MPKRIEIAIASTVGSRRDEEVAEALGIDPSKLSRWQSPEAKRDRAENMRIHEAVAFCQLLGIRLEWLILGEGDIFPVVKDTRATHRK